MANLTNTMNEVLTAAQKDRASKGHELAMGFGDVEFNGVHIRVILNPVKTNSKRQVNRLWEVNGKKVAAAKVAATVEAIIAERAETEEKPTPINASIKLKCAEIRDVAKGWTGTRKEFIADMVHNGVNPATAATQWQRGRK